MSTPKSKHNNGGNSNNNNNNKSRQSETENETDRKFRIPPLVIGLVLSLVLNFCKARWKGFRGRSSSGINSNNHAASSPNRIRPPLTPEERTVQVQESLAKAARGSGTKVHSHFITDPHTLEQLSHPQLWEDCTNRNPTQMSWMDVGATPSNIWEELAVQMWKDHPLLVQQQQQQQSNHNDISIVGYEYWCNIITPDAQLNWHVDKDEVVFETSETLVSPYMGAVYYGYPHQFTGGFLELLHYHPDEIPLPIGYDEWTEKIKAEYNRLVLLNVSQWHRVTPVTSGARYTLAVNVWTERPKEIVERTNGNGNNDEEQIANTV